MRRNPLAVVMRSWNGRRILSRHDCGVLRKRIRDKAHPLQCIGVHVKQLDAESLRIRQVHDRRDSWHSPRFDMTSKAVSNGAVI